MTSALPMESNPDIMNKYLIKLGVSENWRMVDVIGLEGEALKWVPRPVLAVVLLFPLSDAYEQHRCKEEREIVQEDVKTPKDVFHLRQVFSNICGTIALVHSIANNTHCIQVNDGLLKKYLKDVEGLDAAAKGAVLEKSTAFVDAYKEVVHPGNQEDVPVNEIPNNHFVAFVHKDGNLYELDGRKSIPICHGQTTPENLLDDAAKICQQFIDREPDNIRFNIVALVPAN